MSDLALRASVSVDAIEAKNRALEQSAVTLEEVAKVLRAEGFPGMADISDKQAARARQAITAQ